MNPMNKTLTLLVSLLAACLAVDAVVAAPATSGLSAEASRLTFSGDPETGWTLFRQKNCMSCHSVWGQGGDLGPDLGRVRAGGPASAAQLAGTMWNHVPRMWEQMEEQNIHFATISTGEMSHLFAFLVFIRYVDEPGDPARGAEVLERSQCSTCHAIGGEGGSVGPDLERWARYVNPIVWAQKMWAHAEEMESEMRGRRIDWPVFGASDLVDIIAHIRSRGLGDAKQYLEPGSAARGRALYTEHGCDSCHEASTSSQGAPDLARADLPQTLAGVASRMWNHAPLMQQAMRDAGNEVSVLEAQEMADIIAYVIMRRYFETHGEVQAGARLYVAKGCATCHRLGEIGGEVGPNLSSLQGRASPVLMAHVMWKYGPSMLTEMSRVGVPWPSFTGSEMDDLISYLSLGDSAPPLELPIPDVDR